MLMNGIIGIFAGLLLATFYECNSFFIQVPRNSGLMMGFSFS